MSQNNDSIASWIYERITLLALVFIISLTRACIGKFRSPTSLKSQMIFLLDEYQANNIPKVDRCQVSEELAVGDDGYEAVSTSRQNSQKPII